MCRPQLCHIVGPITDKQQHIHFEDILDQHRLNEDIDLQDGRIQQLLDNIRELDENKYTQVIDQSYINQIKDSEILIKMHMDGGANRSVTNDERLLHDIRRIPTYKMRGAQNGPADIICNKKGVLRLLCEGRGVIEVETYYSPHVSETIISPGDITDDSSNSFTTWEQRSNHQTQQGYIRFTSTNGIHTATVSTIMKNRLWYVQQSLLDCIHPKYKHKNETPERDHPVIKQLTTEVLHELWHQRLCHPGKTITENIHLTTEGVPMINKGRNPLYHCRACDRAKIESVSKTKVKHNNKQNTSSALSPSNLQKSTATGQHFHMDFGFIRGSDYSRVDSAGKLITSIDGYRAYLIIVDSHSGYMWVMLAQDKTPPIEFIKDFLSKNGNPRCPIKRVRTDQGGELWKSQMFKSAIKEAGFLCEPTGAGDPSQNGRAEAPNKTLARMIRSMLYSAALGSEYWSYALLHAVYIKNRLPHARHKFKKTPYEVWTGTKPNLSLLRVWGCRVMVKQPNPRTAKLDTIAREGLFMRYTATDKNIVYLDIESRQELIGSHVKFDEANFIDGSQNPGAIALRQASIHSNSTSTKYQSIQYNSSTSDTIEAVKMNPKAILPTRATTGSAGLDLTTIHPIEIKPKHLLAVSTGIALKFPPNTYGRILPRSGNTVHKHIDVKAGVIDQDYTGEIKVLLYNFGDTIQSFSAGDRIAQLVVSKIEMSSPTWTNTLPNTQRNSQGFGSSDVNKGMDKNTAVQNPNPTSIKNTAVQNPNPTTICEQRENYAQITLSNSSLGPTLEVTCKVKGNDDHLGMALEMNEDTNRLTLTEYRKGTPAARIPRWRSTLRGAVLLKIDNTNVSTKEDVTEMIRKLKLNNMKQTQLLFATEDKVPVHTQQGIPQLYYDQLNIIAQHHQELREQATIALVHSEHDEMKDSTIHQLESHSNLKQPKKLTRRYLKSQPDWNDWKQSEAKQLEQYRKQQMFGDPQPKPKDSNVLHLLWTYLIKKNGVKKARCCCNGSPGRKGSVTLDHTYAACVEQPAQRVFWAISALKGYVAVGADASNAFAEAPPPKAPLYVYADQPFREWWKDNGHGEIPSGHVLRVHHAIQGHPEAPRLWSTFIDNILQEKLNLKPSTHEPCLYRGSYQGQEILFLRQVDDFAVSSKDPATCNKLIQELDTYLKEPLKNEGIINRFNGTEIEQTQQYIKIHNTQYIQKIIENHGWTDDNDHTSNRPIPMRNDSKYLFEIENTTGPSTPKEKFDLEQRMGFSYRQAIGEALYAMVTCRPDISIAVTKLSQYSNSPAEIHYKAIKNLFRYLRATANDGLIFWKSQKQHTDILPAGKMPTSLSDSNEHSKNIITHDEQEILNNMYGFCDSDWAGDSNHRHSVTGIAIFLAGAVVAYKSKFQRTVALSSTEAEFSAACETGKMILYLRSILEELQVEQTQATVMYEDNMGALLMANSGQPTKRTRHVETSQFAILDWVQRDLIHLQYSKTSDNCADAMTKPLARILFHKHMDRIMGRIIPTQFRITQGDETSTHTSKCEHAKNVRTLLAWGG